MFHFLSKYLLPHFCVLCGAKTAAKIDLCPACEQDLPQLKIACKCCGTPLSQNIESCAPNSESTLCGACIENPSPYERALSLYHYKNPVDFLLLGCKFRDKLVYAEVLGTLLMRYLERYYKVHSKPEAIIPIPLHYSRLKERGYNQAAEIARPIARALHIPCKLDYCLRVKQTAAQSLLSINERKHNVTRAFTLARPLPYKHIAVIDDIITTGNTMHEFCRTLRQHTKELRIDVWSVART